MPLLSGRSVQTFMSALKKYSVGNIETKLARFLFHNDLTHVEMLMGRHLETNLGLMKANVAAHIHSNQARIRFDFTNMR